MTEVKKRMVDLLIRQHHPFYPHRFALGILHEKAIYPGGQSRGLQRCLPPGERLPEDQCFLVGSHAQNKLPGVGVGENKDCLFFRRSVFLACWLEENTNTDTLVERLLSKDYANKVIVTTIQKLGLALN